MKLKRSRNCSMTLRFEHTGSLIAFAMLWFLTVLLMFPEPERSVVNSPPRYWHKKAHHSLC
jgi:hypothetical protein